MSRPCFSAAAFFVMAFSSLAGAGDELRDVREQLRADLVQLRQESPRPLTYRERLGPELHRLLNHLQRRGDFLLAEMIGEPVVVAPQFLIHSALPPENDADRPALPEAEARRTVWRVWLDLNPPRGTSPDSIDESFAEWLALQRRSGLLFYISLDGAAVWYVSAAGDAWRFDEFDAAMDASFLLRQLRDHRFRIEFDPTADNNGPLPGVIQIRPNPEPAVEDDDTGDIKSDAAEADDGDEGY